MIESWTPLAVQEGTEPGALRDAVPDVLEEPLRQWILRVASRAGVDTHRLMIMLGLVLPTSYVEAQDRAWQEYKTAAAQHAKQQAQLREKTFEASDTGPAPTTSSALTIASFYTGPALPTDPVPTFVARGTDRAMLLPVIHGLLHLLPYLPPSPPSADPATRLVNTARRKLKGSDRETLAQLLDDGRMLYRIRSDGKGLERRVSVPSTAHAQLSADAAIRAGRHNASERLIKAWSALYSPESDPGASYGHAVRAVEAAAIPIFLPAAMNPSLGTVRDHLDQARSKYELVIADKVNSPGSIDVIVEMSEPYGLVTGTATKEARRVRLSARHLPRRRCQSQRLWSIYSR